jgi:phosphatidate cytidylyltransferase
MYLFALISLLMIREFSLLIDQSGRTSLPSALCLSGALLAFGLDNERWMVVYAVFILILFIAELYRRQEHAIENWAFIALTQLYIALPLALVNVLTRHTPHYALPLAVFVFIWLNDTGAYCVGSLVGKTPLFQRISPKKSWEGTCGGAAFAMISAVVFYSVFPELLSVMQWIGLSVIVVIFGTWGDLVESLLKRKLNIKDSGNFLPGHGGILDRFDSSLLAIPAAVLYLYLVT